MHSWALGYCCQGKGENYETRNCKGDFITRAWVFLGCTVRTCELGGGRGRRTEMSRGRS